MPGETTWSSWTTSRGRGRHEHRVETDRVGPDDGCTSSRVFAPAGHFPIQSESLFTYFLTHLRKKSKASDNGRKAQDNARGN
jgi:hypothetical protein